MRELRQDRLSGWWVIIAPGRGDRPREFVQNGSHHSVADSELEEYGLVLRRSLRRLHAVHGALSYNFVIDSAGAGDTGAQHLHWRLRIAPKLTHWGGFESGMDIPVNPSSPEKDAAAFRYAGPL